MIEVDKTAKDEVSKLMESDGYNPSKVAHILYIE